MDYQITYEREVFAENIKLASNPIYWPVSLPLDLSIHDPSGLSFEESSPENILEYTCPNCGGELLQRPTRSKDLLLKHPASSERIVKDSGCH